MHNMRPRAFRRTRLAAGVGAALLSLSAGHALGAAFALQEQNASGLGHAYAGGAAAAEDVSTIFYNPAGLVRLQSMQLVVAANLICPSTKFHDGGSQAAFGQPLGGTGGDAGSCAGVPNLYFGVPFTDKWSFGIGVNVPYGLKTEYDSDWLGRFQAIKSKVETYNVNPVLSWEPTPQTRIGAAYRSPIKYTVDGNVSFDNPTAVGTLPPQLAPAGAAILNGVNAQLFDGGVTLKIKMPSTANVSVFHQFDNKWDLMADLQYTGWSSIEQLQIVRTTGPILSTTPENFRNTWRVSAGANYRYTDKWTLRGGVAWDQTPVRDEQRTPRLPDNDRTWLAFGAQYKFSDNWSIDAAYAYIWLRDASINQNAGNTAANGLISGTYKANVNIVGLQV